MSAAQDSKNNHDHNNHDHNNHDDDDKPTVVLDLNALKKQKLKLEEDLANVATDLEFTVPKEELPPQRTKPSVPVILFDFGSELFTQGLSHFPAGHEYKVAKTLAELNNYLKSKLPQIIVFNYDANPKAINQLCAQIKAKKPMVRTMIMARSISPQRALAHSQTPSGANGYYQLPLSAEKIEVELDKIISSL
jgi:hypothetical protein